MGYDCSKPLPLPPDPPKITRAQYYYETAHLEAIFFEEAAEVAAARKRKPEAKQAARENPPPEDWRLDENREILEMFPTEEDFQYCDAAKKYTGLR